MSREFTYDDEGRLIRGSIRSYVPTYDEAAPTMDIEREAVGLSTLLDISYMEALLIVRERHADINEAADWLNDATKDMPSDKFAAVLQAAIARRD
jgi:hypothetical protein